MMLLLRILAAAAAVSAFLGRAPRYYHQSSSSVLAETTKLFSSSSRSSIDTLQQQIIQGATLKLLNKEDHEYCPGVEGTRQNNLLEKAEDVVDEDPNTSQFTYYVRQAKRSEVNKITDVLMASFHSQSQPTFDSYIRRYKSNHLRMCFDTIDESDRGIFVACASPSSESSSSEEEILVGFCLVDGRTPDPSCKIEFLTPSTLESTSPRPYLSDLGVIPSHRRRGLGELLVKACERWAADKRGYEKLYLKVEKSNKPGVGLYYGMGYKRTKLPWAARDSKNVERSSNTLLLEKSLLTASPSLSKRKRKRTWIKQQLWEPMMAALNSNNNLPL